MPTPDTPTNRLLRFNSEVLAQALALAAAHEAPGAPVYARPVGAHLRHVIEHYEALLQPAEPGVVDYDARPRDSALEQSPQVARQRLSALMAALQDASSTALDATVSVRGQGGLMGDFDFEVQSTVARELVFAASHAVHHYAVLVQHCKDHGLAISAHFGKAPATVAHEIALETKNAALRSAHSQPQQELTCKPISATA